jgi:MSHA biogenesis protein MshQ
MNKMKRVITLLLLGSLGLAGADEAMAATCTSVANSNWSSAATWSCGHVPLATDAVVIASPNTVVMDDGTCNGNYNPTVASLTVNAGATVDDAGNNLFTSGNVVINGTFGVSPGACGGGGTITMQGANTTLSGTGSIVDVTVEIDNTGVSIPVGSSLNFSMGGQIDVGANIKPPATASLTINGTITGVGQQAGNSIIIAEPGATITINGTVDAPLAGAKVKEGGVIINNGTVNVSYLEGQKAKNGQPAGIWTQGPNSMLTVTSTPTNKWQGTFNASATGNTVNYNGTATPANLTPTPTAPTNLPTFYNLGWPGATCPITAYTILGISPCQPPPLARYHMDESSWSGVAGQVVDSSGNGNNAQSFNSSTTDGATSAIVGNPGTCRYGVFDNGSTITAGYVQTPLPDLTTDFTVTAWVRTTNNAATGQRILIDDQSNSGGYGISLGDGAAGKVRFYSRAINPIILDSTYTLLNNRWYFVAAVADITNRIRTLYVFDSSGTLLGSNGDTAAFTGTWGTDAGPVSIGGETNASGESPANFHFRGNLDEVQVFKAALNQTQLAQIATQTHPCAVNVPDHLEIQSSGTGVTCTPSTVTIKACANAACTAPYTAGVTGTLSATGTPTVNWSGGTGFSILSGSSTVTKNVQVTTVGNVVFNAVSTPSAIAATTCNFGTPACTFTTADSILLVSAPNHVAETLSSLTIQAVKSAPGNPLVCVPGMTGTKTVNLKCAYANPVAGTLPVRVGGSVLNGTNNVAAACDAGGGNVPLTFDATGVATPSLQYADVGQMTVSASYTGAPGAMDAGLSMFGSGSFIAAPASFGFSATTGGPIKAGNNFAATITAKNSAGNTTSNFGKETTAEGVTLSSNLVTPAAGANPSLGGNLIAGTSFTNGVATASNLTWGEVGNITLTANLTSGSYLGSGLTATGTSASVGSFIPDHLDTAVVPTATLPMPCPTGLTCPGLYNGFVYSGQPFSVQVTARNLAGGTTANYSSAYGLSNNVNLSAWNALGSTVAPTGAGALANTAMVSTAFNSGVGLTNTQAYTFASSPTAPTNIFLRAVDSVNTSVTSLRATPATSVEGGVKLVSGKVKISNAHGSELLKLPVAVTAQYWNGTSYVASSTDSVSSFVVANVVFNNWQKLITSSGWTTGSTSVVTPPASVVFTNGTGSFMLSTPGANNTGSVDMTTNGTGASPSTAAYLPSNTARATFGVYKGANEFIYLRENY